MALQEEFENQGNWLFRYRGTLPLIFLSVGLFVYLRSKVIPGAFFLTDTNNEVIYNYFCLFVSLFGFGIRAHTVGYTPRNTSGRNVDGQLAESLNTKGIYSTVRHPLYLGNFFMWLGPVLLTGNFWFIIAFSLLYWVYYERIMFAEEQFLRRKFGKIYIDWANYVPAFMPSFKRFEKPELSFSWKKVLKKEKNGFTAIFIVFTLFNILGELVQKKTDFDYVLISGCIVSGLLYLVLKFLKKKTDVLNEEGR